MAHSAPGKHYRQGISLVDAFKQFPNDEAAEQWFIAVRWPHGVTCPHCDATETVKTTHPSMPFRCKKCRKFFSARTGTVMQSSKLGYQVWALAMYILNTGIKGTSSMKLHRDFGITQKTAWHLAHRIRECWADKQTLAGPVEVDETYVGGKEVNKHANKRRQEGRGGVGKEIVVGIKSRNDGRVTAAVVPTTCAGTLQRFVRTHCEPQAQVYSDQNPGYQGLQERGYRLESVNHSVKEYVRGQAHTNGIESFWAMLKRGYHGTYHKMSPKHLQRYVNEFAGRQNARDAHTVDQLVMIAKGIAGKTLPYRELIAN